MKAVAVPNVNYQAIEAERYSEIQKAITERLIEAKESGGNLRQIVLGAIVDGNYDEAKASLNGFLLSRGDFPNFQYRSMRHRGYAEDLINAIQVKRNFQGLGTLPLSKQQEIYEKVLEHFEELKSNLKIIEKYEKEAKLDDIRSTARVLQALSYSVGTIFFVALYLDVTNGVAGSFVTVFESVVGQFSEVIFSFIGL